MWRSVIRHCTQRPGVYQVIFVLTLALGLLLGIRPTPPLGGIHWIMTGLHVGGMLACTLLSYPAFPRWHTIKRFVIVFSVGLAVEFGQSFLPSRTADLSDLMANLLGVTLGLLTIALWQKLARYGWLGAERPAA